MVEIATLANEVLVMAHDLAEQLAELSIDQIIAICRLTAAEAETLQQMLQLAHDAAHVLNRAVMGLRDLLACETFHPIYTTFVHNAFCVQGVGGINAIFYTTLVISIFSMCMIMFRAALYPIKEPGVDKDEVEIAKDHNEPPCDKDAKIDEAVEFVKDSDESPGEGDVKVTEAVVY